MTVNPARGEVALKVGDVDLVLACELSSLAAFEALIEEKYPRPDGRPRGMGQVLMFASAIPFAVIKDALACFVVRGDVGAALKAMHLSDTIAIQRAIDAVIGSKYMEKVGNADAAGETA